MKRKFKLIVPSFLTLIFCLLLIAGSTFAIFSSQAEASIEVKTGKVHVTASLTGLQAYSAEAITETEYNALTDENAKYKAGQAEAFGVSSYYKYSTTGVETVVANASYKFATKGTAELTNDKTLILDKIVPGDKVTLNLGLENGSNVDVKYRVRLNAIEDNGLLDGLTVKVNGTELVGTIKNTAWSTLAASGTISDMPLEVLLPITAGNEYQEKTAKLRFTVEMVQANAKVDEVLDLVNAYLAEQNPRNKTMWDAIQDANTWLNTSAGQGKSFTATNYVWNMDTDQFYAEGNVVTGQGFESRFFKAYTEDDMPSAANQKFSIYATGAWTNPVNVVVGFDAGDATGISSITYDRHDATEGQEVVIRTNSMDTNLTVNAPLDVVHHYGPAGYLKIEAVANSSYHEFGQVAFVEIAKGRVALEKGSSATQVHITKKENEEKFDEIIVSIEPTVAKPTFSRDEVEISSQGTLVVALQAGTEEVKEDTELDYVWLTKQGIYEQIKVSDSKEEITADAKWADELDSTVPAQAKTQNAAIDIANNIGRNSNNKVESHVVVNNESYTVTLNEETRELVVETAAQQEEVDAQIQAEVKVEAIQNTGIKPDDKADKIEDVINDTISSLYVVRISDRYYETFEKGFDASVSGDTLYVISNCSAIRHGTKAYDASGKNLTINVQTGVTLDCGNVTNGKFDIGWNNAAGTLTFDGNGKITFVTNSNWGLVTKNGSGDNIKAVVKNVTIEASVAGGQIMTGSGLTVESGHFKNIDFVNGQIKQGYKAELNENTGYYDIVVAPPADAIFLATSNNPNISPIYLNEADFASYSFSENANYVTGNYTLKLLKDYTFGDDWNVDFRGITFSGSNVVFDLNGKTIRYEGFYNLFEGNNSENVTIMNGTIISSGLFNISSIDMTSLIIKEDVSFTLNALNVEDIDGYRDLNRYLYIDCDNYTTIKGNYSPFVQTRLISEGYPEDYDVKVVFGGQEIYCKGELALYRMTHGSNGISIGDLADTIYVHNAQSVYNNQYNLYLKIGQAYNLVIDSSNITVKITTTSKKYITIDGNKQQFTGTFRIVNSEGNHTISASNS